MSFWGSCVCCFVCSQLVSAQYFFWTQCHLQYGGECRPLCHHGEVNLGLPYCNTPDNDIVSFQGTCCVALPCWYLGGICRRSCLPLSETKYDLSTTCPDFRSTCCIPSRDLPSSEPPLTSTGVTTSSTSTVTSTTDATTTTLPDRIGNCGLPQTESTNYSVTSPGPCVVPWMVSLRTTFSQHYCSGVLVSHNTILTAAGCVYGIETTDLVAILGDFDVGVAEATEVVVTITSIIPHPLHRNNRRGFDLALLKFSDSINSTCVSRLCLPGTNTSPANLGYGRCLLAGWGESQGQGQGQGQGQVYTISLRAVSIKSVLTATCSEVTVEGETHELNVQVLRVYETTACSRLLSALHSNSTLPDDVICTLQEDTEPTGACRVDGGSILMCPDLNERYFLFGVVTEFTCNNPAMALYTDISYHSAWITRHSQRVT